MSAAAEILTIPDRRQWLEWRRAGLGASDAAAVCGLSPWSNPTLVWLEKTGKLPIEEDESETMEWGRLLEPAVIHKFEQRTGLVVANRQRLAVSPDVPFMRATLDGTVHTPAADSAAPALGVYEGKTASMGSHRWADGAVPDEVAIQVQHQLAVTGLPAAWVAAFLMAPTPHLVIHEVARDETAIAVLLEIEGEFWRHVEADTPPPVMDASQATQEALRRAFAHPGQSAVELPPDALELIQIRERARLEAKAAEERQRLAENSLAMLLADAEVGTLGGDKVCSWSVVERTDIDRERLKAEFPEAYQASLKTGTYRRWWMRPQKED